MALKPVDKTSLKVGDTIGVPIEIRIGWSTFRYCTVHPKTIARITPARTKFIMTDGTEYTKHITFCMIDEETEHWNTVAKAAQRINNALYLFDQSKSRGELFKKDDDTLLALSDLLSKAADILSPERGASL